MAVIRLSDGFAPGPSMKDISEDLRPREKAVKYGFGGLSKAELLAIIIGDGSVGESVLSLSQRILRDNDNRFDVLVRKTIPDLIATYRGVGEAKATAILAAANIGRVFCEESENPNEVPRITDSESAYKLLRHIIGHQPHEEFWVITLGASKRVINLHQISKGGVRYTAVDPKMVMKCAVNDLADSIILCHNHPSGSSRPSNADIELTKKLVKAGKSLEVEVVDHIVIGDSDYVSLADNGLMFEG